MSDRPNCHCGRETTDHESGRVVCSGCEKFTDFCVGDAEKKTGCPQIAEA